MTIEGVEGGILPPNPRWDAARTDELARAYLAAIVESSEDAIIGKDLGCIITSWNPGAERLYGYAAHEAVGRSIAMLVPPERPDELPSIMARLGRGFDRPRHHDSPAGRAGAGRPAHPRARGPRAARRHLGRRCRRCDRPGQGRPLRLREQRRCAPRRLRDRRGVPGRRHVRALEPAHRPGCRGTAVPLRAAPGPARAGRRAVAGDGRAVPAQRHRRGALVAHAGPRHQGPERRAPGDQHLPRHHRGGAFRGAAAVPGGRRRGAGRAARRRGRARGRGARASATLADWAIVVLVGEDGQIERTASAHRDPAQDALVREIGARYPLRPGDGSVLWRVIAQTETVLVPDVTDAMLARVVRDPEQRRLVARLGITSVIYVPLVARGRTLGALGLFGDDPLRRFDAKDRGIAEEIARRAALSLDNARLYRAARDALATRDEFLSIASHELRTPVTAISGIAQLMQRARQRGRLDAARLDRALEQITRGSERLASLTEDLLDVSRLQTGHFELRPRPIDVRSFIADVADRHHEHLDGRHRLALDVAGTTCAVRADPSRLEQVIANLLSNAAKYSPDGGTIAVAVARDGDGVRLDVRDQGIGLPPGVEESIFRPFGRAANAAKRQIPGLGLGLHICRQIVERHGGRIWAESPGEGQGTAMHVWLPCAEESELGG